MRKLPVYFVVDVSESMIGDAIDQVNDSVKRMVAALRRNPYALETVWLSVISFDSKARVVVPLTDICEFAAPNLAPRPGTALGSALELTRKTIAQDVVPTTRDRKGDWRPMVFLLTDGQPTDQWSAAAKKLRESSPRPSKIYAIGVGDEVDFSVLKSIGDVTYRVSDLTDGRMEDLFVWMSASIQSASVNLDKTGAQKEVAPPDGIEEVGDDFEPAPNYPKQLFFHFTCCDSKKKYLARYRYDESIQKYRVVMSYPVPAEFFADSPAGAQKVEAEKIEDVPTCPYCGRNAWYLCKCGEFSDVCNVGEKCPACGKAVQVFGQYNGGVDRSLG